MGEKKIKNLKKLRNKIIDELFKNKWEEVWFFPEYEQVKGFLGTQRIMFVGLNPSYSPFPDEKVKFFYKQLKKYGFKNAHLTDLIKTRLTNKEIKDKKKFEKFVEEQKKFLKEEIDIIKPKIIGALGKECEKWLKEKFPKESIEYVCHYSYAKRYNNKQKFIKDIQKIRNKYEKKESNNCFS